MATSWYYHAGVEVVGEIRWSDDDPTTDRAEAEADARCMAEDHGGSPVVEYWYVSHGPNPGPDAVAGMYRVRPED